VFTVDEPQKVCAVIRHGNVPDRRRLDFTEPAGGVDGGLHAAAVPFAGETEEEQKDDADDGDQGILSHVSSGKKIRSLPADLILVTDRGV
jgi:hypothetical protein